MKSNLTVTCRNVFRARRHCRLARCCASRSPRGEVRTALDKDTDRVAEDPLSLIRGSSCNTFVVRARDPVCSALAAAAWARALPRASSGTRLRVSCSVLRHPVCADLRASIWLSRIAAGLVVELAALIGSARRGESRLRLCACSAAAVLPRWIWLHTLQFENQELASLRRETSRLLI